MVISDHESDLQRVQRRAAVKEIATGFYRQSKLPGSSDVISSWYGRNLSEQVTFDCFMALCCLYSAFVKRKCFKV